VLVQRKGIEMTQQAQNDKIDQHKDAKRYANIPCFHLAKRYRQVFNPGCNFCLRAHRHKEVSVAQSVMANCSKV